MAVPFGVAAPVLGQRKHTAASRARKLAQSPRIGQLRACPGVPCKFFPQEPLDAVTARKITYGSSRAFTLPEGADKDKLNAEDRNGILEITAPIAGAALPRKVEIKALPGRAAQHAIA